MRRLLKMVPIIFVALLVLSCNPTVYESFGDLEGTVLDEETNKPIKYVYVMLSPGGKNMTTGADGKFSFVDLDPQQYTVTVQKTVIPPTEKRKCNSGSNDTNFYKYEKND